MIQSLIMGDRPRDHLWAITPTTEGIVYEAIGGTVSSSTFTMDETLLFFGAATQARHGKGREEKQSRGETRHGIAR